MVCSIGYQVYSADDPGLTLTYFTARSNSDPYAFVGDKGKIIDFPETIVVYDVRVGRFSQLNEYMQLYEYHSLTFVQGHSDSTFSNFFCSETAWSIEAKFHLEPPCDVGNANLFKCSRSHMMKNLKNLVLGNQEADDLETWYTASGIQVLPMFSYDHPRMTLTI